MSLVAGGLSTRVFGRPQIRSRVQCHDLAGECATARTGAELVDTPKEPVIEATEPTARDRAILSRAASLLDSVGADVWTPAEVVVPCMLAAQLMECAGGRARRVPLIGDEIGPTIRAAMTAMSQLDKRTFGTDNVLEAGRAARYALRVLG